MSIFKGGHLKSEFINPNYRGLVGWPCKFSNQISESTLDMINSQGDALIEGHNRISNIRDVHIEKFTPDKIPEGELCWFEVGKGCNSWRLDAFVSCDEYGIYYSATNTESQMGCVPYLIAETAEDAERLKDWSKA
jgi:hypothetical protein